jgi:ankyrin repeat protein
MNKAFARMTEPRVIINCLEGLECARILLESGVDARLRNGSLIKALESNTNGQLDDFVGLLLQHRPNVNIENGRCFVAAARLDNMNLFEKLLDPAHKPSTEVVPRALIKSVQREEKLVQLLRLFFRCVDCAFLPGDNELIFLALNYFPRGENLIKVLLDCGCPGGATQMKRIVGDIGVEPVTPLIWALQLSEPRISDLVIRTLLEIGQRGKVLIRPRTILLRYLILTHCPIAKPNYVTPSSRMTAAILAAKGKRCEILKRLLELEVDMSFRDEKKRSALFYACNEGDLPSVTLMVGRVRPNDGSLHEAARGAHPEIVGRLLVNRNDPNVSFEGRSALAELCFRGRPDGDDWESRASEVIQLLLDSGTKLARKYNDGKTILHLALDNPIPEAITTVLLDFPDICNQINEDIFLFENEAGICYSLINYVENFYEGSINGMRDTLIKLLKHKGCERRLFSKYGNHPKGYTGLPPVLEERARRQSLLDNDHYQDLRRLKERATVLMEIGNLQHNQSLQHSNQTHEANLYQSRQLEAQQAEGRQNKHLMDLTHRSEVNSEENRMIQVRQQLTLKNEAEAYAQRQRFQEADQVREFNHSSRMALLGHETLENKVNVQRKLLNEQESAATRQYNRNVSFLDRQDKAFKTQAEAMKSIQASNSTGRGQYRLGNGDEWGSVD